MKFRLLCIVALLLLQVAPAQAGASIPSSSHETTQEHVQGKNPKKHEAEMMEWLKSHPQEYEQFLTLTEERHLIMAELARKTKQSAALWQDANARQDEKVIETARKLKEERMSTYRKELHQKHAELRDQCLALIKQKDKLNESQQKKAIESILQKSTEINELLKEKSKTLDEINHILQAG